MDVAQADYDALADLFLSDEPVGRPQPPSAPLKLATNETAEPVKTPSQTSPAPAPATVSVEGILAGHLPVLASAWVTQYARHLADSHKEPVALLRLVAGQAVLDLILPSGHKIPADITASASEPLTTVLARLTPRFRRWVIRVDEPCEPDFFCLAGVSRIAILTGADDPAVLASFQAIKSLSQDLTEAAPQLGLVVMGATDERAAIAEGKLRRAASQFLGKDLPPATKIPRIGSSLAVHLYRAHTSSTIADVVAALRSASLRDGLGVRSSDSRSPNNGGSTHALQPPVLTPSSFTSSPPHLPTSSAPPASRVGPLPTGDPILSQLQLAPLTITCPYAPAIRAAADAQGRLHLLAMTDLAPADGAARLLTAASWASDHAALLTAAAPSLKSAAEPTLHVLTTDAKLVRSLLDTGLRLHVVTRVEVAGQSHPAVAALN
jgi:hypothetical protein